jgi:geranylgeranyl diphosphate synthase type II
MGHLTGRGKLFRPLLALATVQALSGAAPAAWVSLVTPLELIHTFTLIHDDLPCMDDAALRRGVAAVHVAHGQAAAVLAGDALLNLALHLLATEIPELEPSRRVHLLSSATRATQQVVEGQMLDLVGEGKQPSADELKLLHEKKTGALLGACCEIGAIIAGANEDLRAELRDIGIRIGLAFQIRDDLLSLQSTEMQMGKTLTTDLEKAKLTFPRVLGIPEAAAYLERVLGDVQRAIVGLDLHDNRLLTELAVSAAERDH